MEDEIGPVVKRPRNESLSGPGRDTITQNGEASVDSGLSDVATPTPDLPTGSPAEPKAGPSQNAQEQDDDNLSEISGLSDMSGKNWKPNMSGRLSWLHRAMARGTDPRSIVANVFENSSIPEGLDDMTIWKILYNIFAEPPKREKLKDFNTLEQVVTKIKEANNIIVLTGAGVSVSCGIPDFRSKDGVYARLAVDFPDLPDPQAMFDIHYFRKDPRPFFKFAKEIYPGQFQPSPCHKFIQCVESVGKLLRNYTQNIDTLEQVAGISKVVQCHGSFATASCTLCRTKVEADTIREEIFEQKIPLCSKCPRPDLEGIIADLAKPKEPLLMSLPSIHKTESTASTAEASLEDASTLALDGLSSASSSLPPPEKPDSFALPSEPFPSPPSASHRQSDGASSSPFTGVPVMKPDIVFFGEGLPEEFHSAIAADKELVDLLIVIGSSLKVRPVALIPSSIPEHVPQILINREPLNHLRFDVELLGDCDIIINQICHMLGEGWSGPIHRPQRTQTIEMPAIDDSLDGRETRPDSGTDSQPPQNKEREELDTPTTSSQDGEQDKDDWKPRISVAEKIPESQFLFIPPSRYIFSGAEVYPEDLSSSDEEDDEEEGEEEEEEEDYEEGEEEEEKEDSDELNTSQSIDLVTSDARDDYELAHDEEN